MEKRTQLTPKRLQFMGVFQHLAPLWVYSLFLLFSLLCSRVFFKKSLCQQPREKIKAPVRRKQVAFVSESLIHFIKMFQIFLREERSQESSPITPGMPSFGYLCFIRGSCKKRQGKRKKRGLADSEGW